MPYIKAEERPAIDSCIKALKENVKTEGHLNYSVTTLCHEFLKEKGLNYANVNTVIGALECIKLELYRKVASPYEDKKIKENGDVNIL